MYKDFNRKFENKLFYLSHTGCKLGVITYASYLLMKKESPLLFNCIAKTIENENAMISEAIMKDNNFIE